VWGRVCLQDGGVIEGDCTYIWSPSPCVGSDGLSSFFGPWGFWASLCSLVCPGPYGIRTRCLCQAERSSGRNSVTQSGLINLWCRNWQCLLWCPISCLPAGSPVHHVRLHLPRGIDLYACLRRYKYVRRPSTSPDICRTITA